MSKPKHTQYNAPLLSPYYIYLCSFSILLVVNIYFYCMLDRSFPIKKTVYIFHIYRLFDFLQFKSCFLANSELITNPIVLLSNKVSTIIPSCVSILSSLIFTVTSLSSSLLFRLQQDVLSITLESIVYLLFLRPN